MSLYYVDMKDAHDTVTPDLLPTPRRRGRPSVGYRAMTPAERKAVQRERERKAFVTYQRDELEQIGTGSLLEELGRLVPAGRPALARAVWEVLEARACAARAELHPEQEQLAAELNRRMSPPQQE